MWTILGWLCGWNISGFCPRWSCPEQTWRWTLMRKVHIKDHAWGKGGEEAELAEGNWGTACLWIPVIPCWMELLGPLLQLRPASWELG